MRAAVDTAREPSEYGCRVGPALGRGTRADSTTTARLAILREMGTARAEYADGL